MVGCRRLDPDIKNYADIFSPAKFKLLMTVAQELCGLDHETGIVKVAFLSRFWLYLLNVYPCV